MSRFVREVVSTIEFEGDTVRVTVQALPLVDLMRLQSCETQVQMAEWAVDVLPRHVVLSGLKDAEGNELVTSDVVKNAYFYNLMTQLVELLTATTRPERPLKPSEH